jgi:hypothetical protein
VASLILSMVQHPGDREREGTFSRAPAQIVEEELRGRGRTTTRRTG